MDGANRVLGEARHAGRVCRASPTRRAGKAAVGTMRRHSQADRATPACGGDVHVRQLVVRRGRAVGPDATRHRCSCTRATRTFHSPARGRASPPNSGRYARIDVHRPASTPSYAELTSRGCLLGRRTRDARFDADVPTCHSWPQPIRVRSGRCAPQDHRSAWHGNLNPAASAVVTTRVSDFVARSDRRWSRSAYGLLHRRCAGVDHAVDEQLDPDHAEPVRPILPTQLGGPLDLRHFFVGGCRRNIDPMAEQPQRQPASQLGRSMHARFACSTLPCRRRPWCRTGGRR